MVACELSRDPLAPDKYIATAKCDDCQDGPHTLIHSPAPTYRVNVAPGSAATKTLRPDRTTVINAALLRCKRPKRIPSAAESLFHLLKRFARRKRRCRRSRTWRGNRCVRWLNRQFNRVCFALGTGGCFELRQIAGQRFVFSHLLQLIKLLRLGSQRDDRGIGRFTDTRRWRSGAGADDRRRSRSITGSSRRC